WWGRANPRRARRGRSPGGWGATRPRVWSEAGAAPATNRVAGRPGGVAGPHPQVEARALEGVAVRPPAGWASGSATAVAVAGEGRDLGPGLRGWRRRWRPRRRRAPRRARPPASPPVPWRP